MCLLSQQNLPDYKWGELIRDSTLGRSNCLAPVEPGRKVRKGDLVSSV